ncbi:DapH/DapD/GlmU-related protein [Demequina sp. NBRC 110055]|uniref:acyltransferase n=1 Tax=Demequina sp. NBRC 110055 TaxID=1570344 RepID=UPI000A06007E|nr:DapH/DapD/GlmU-related protein [Demequina sp. NBRC 110055]
MKKLSNARRIAIRILRGREAEAKYLGVELGANVRLLSSGFGSEPWLVSIGTGTTISGRVQFITHDGIGALVRDENGRRYRYERIEVGAHCFVGFGVIVMPGVRIGDGAVVGAGAVVTKSVAAGTVVAGNPAMPIAGTADLLDRVAKWPSDSDRRTRDLRQWSTEVARGVHGEWESK